MFEPEPRRDSAGWTDDHQKLHSLLWSAFLNITSDYDSGRFRKRYAPVHATETFRQLRDHTKEERAPRLRTDYLKAAAWMLAPRFCGSDHDEAPSFRGTYRRLFGVDLAAERSSGLSRPPLPAMPELGIEGTSVRIETSPPAVRVHMEAVVQSPFLILREIVYPWKWTSCFWGRLPESQTLLQNGFRGRLPAAVRLPGGELVNGKVTKTRPLLLDVDITTSPFAARLDYSGLEKAAKEKAAALANRTGKQARKRLIEIAAVSGFLLVEKLAGRPGACRVVAEREAIFSNFNHRLFAAETVTYWLASELISFCEFARQPPAPIEVAPRRASTSETAL